MALGSLIIVHVTMAVFNILASIIQGLTGFGDAILLHVLWYTASIMAPDIFNTTPLGDEPVRVVALLMYVRIIFSTPLVAYLSLKDGVFSLTMSVAMAIPSTVTAILGIFIFAGMSGEGLKKVLGISSLIFAFLYVVILGGRFLWRRYRIQRATEDLVARGKGGGEAETQSPIAPGDAVRHPSRHARIPVGGGGGGGKARQVTIVSEADAVAEEFNHSRNASFAGGSAAAHCYATEAAAANASLTAGGGPPHGGGLAKGKKDHPLSREEEQQQQHGSGAASGNCPSPPQRLIRQPPARLLARGPLARGLNAEEMGDGEKETPGPVLLSTVTGSPFHAKEARPPVLREAGVAGRTTQPPLTPSKLSPTATLTHTRVRVNRNLDENGKIRLSTKVAASVAAALSGVMGSLTGVGAPPQIIFLLLFDVPQYIIRVNWSVQSIPSSAMRFIIACVKPLFTKGMIPLFVNAVLFGYIGVFTGNKLGKMLGPNSYNVFVLVLLLISSLVMITTSVAVLVSCTVFGTVLTIAAAFYEYRMMHTKVATQRAMEDQLAAMSAAEMEEEEEAAARAQASHHSPSGGLSDAVDDDGMVLGDSASAVGRPSGRNTPAASPPPRQESAVTLASEAEAPGSDFPGSERHSTTSGRVRRAELMRPPSLFSSTTSSFLGEAPPRVKPAVVKHVPAVTVSPPSSVPPASATRMLTEDTSSRRALVDEEELP